MRGDMASGDSKQLSFQFDPVQQKALERKLANMSRSLPSVISRGINRTAKDSQSRIVNKLSFITKFKPSILKKVITLFKATQKRLQATISLRRKRIPAIALAPRRTTVGVTYQDIKERKLIEHGFIAKMPTGHKGVFRRKYSGGKMVGRLPIKEMYGPALPEIFRESEELAVKEMANTQQELLKNIQLEVQALLSKKAAKAKKAS